ncbi:hypothetical protein G6F22_021814 [Rhizopus arrhizus]|nr:hypothetical protein G6F22_021814 [Rhizopus arrhizus]
MPVLLGFGPGGRRADRQTDARDRLRQKTHAGARRQRLARQRQPVGADFGGGNGPLGDRRDDAGAAPAAPRRQAPGCPRPGGRENAVRNSRSA